MFFRTCMTASKTSLLRFQRMMGTIWRTLSLTLTERAGSSNWVSPSWCFFFQFNRCFLADLWIDITHSYCRRMISCYLIAALRTIFPKNKMFDVVETLTFLLHGELCGLSSTKRVSIYFPLSVSYSLFLYPVAPPLSFSWSLLAPALLDLWFFCCWWCSPCRRYVHSLFPF